MDVDVVVECVVESGQRYEVNVASGKSDPLTQPPAPETEPPPGQAYGESPGPVKCLDGFAVRHTAATP